MQHVAVLTNFVSNFLLVRSCNNETTFPVRFCVQRLLRNEEMICRLRFNHCWKLPIDFLSEKILEKIFRVNEYKMTS